MSELYGPNTEQVTWVVDLLGTQAVSEWDALERICSSRTFARDHVRDAIAFVVWRRGGNSWWSRIKDVSRQLAMPPAAQSDRDNGVNDVLESSTTAYNWTGEVELVTAYYLEPSRLAPYTNAAQDVLGLVMARPYGTRDGWLRLWSPLEGLVPLVASEQTGTVGACPGVAPKT